MSNYNTQLQSNNVDLQTVLQTLQNKAAGGEQTAPVISVNASTGLITATAGTKSATKQLAFQAAKTITPGTANQTAVAANTYVGGAITVKGDTNLKAENIKSGISIFGVTGTHVGEGGGSTPSNPSALQNEVNFYDYDGTLLYSYTVEEVQALTSLPPLPTQPGLTCQDWNYDLATIKSYNRAVNVGATYITDDGKTRLYIRIAAEGRMDVPLYFSQTVSNGVTIDWGDGSATQTLSGTGNVNTTHTYSTIGDYVISLDVTSGTLGLGHNLSSYCVMGSTKNIGIIYCNMLQKVEIGTGITSIGELAFSYCYSLASIIIPNSVTNIGDAAFFACYSLTGIAIPDSVTGISDSVFYNCHSLSKVVIPNSVTSIGSLAFDSCYSLANIVIPDGVTNIYYNAFTSCYSLTSVVIPDSVTGIGASMFGRCYSLTSIVIPNSVNGINDSMFSDCYSLVNVVIPDGVKRINYSAFSDCYSLTNIVIPDGVIVIGNNAFDNCYSLSSIVIPDSVTSIGKLAFSYCYSLANVVIPDGITSINYGTFDSCYSLANIVIPDSVTGIGDKAFDDCYSLANVVIPNSVTSIGSLAFNNCSGMAFYDFTSHTSVPKLSNTNAFNGIPSDCEIRVPAALYDEWKSATNWSTYASYIVAV